MFVWQAHVKSALIGASVTIPIRDGRLVSKGKKALDAYIPKMEQSSSSWESDHHGIRPLAPGRAFGISSSATRRIEETSLPPSRGRRRLEIKRSCIREYMTKTKYYLLLLLPLSDRSCAYVSICTLGIGTSPASPLAPRPSRVLCFSLSSRSRRSLLNRYHSEAPWTRPRRPRP